MNWFDVGLLCGASVGSPVEAVSETFNRAVSETFNRAVSETFNRPVSETFNRPVSETFNTAVCMSVGVIMSELLHGILINSSVREVLASSHTLPGASTILGSLHGTSCCLFEVVFWSQQQAVFWSQKEAVFWSQ